MAKKRHHASKRARHDEHMGMERHERGPVYGQPAKHRAESGHPVKNYVNEGIMHHSGFIAEDRSAPALLPQHVIEKYYPNAYGYHNAQQEDLFSGVQKQLMEDGSDYRKENKPKKY